MLELNVACTARKLIEYGIVTQQKVYIIPGDALSKAASCISVSSLLCRERSIMSAGRLSEQPKPAMNSEYSRGHSLMSLSARD